VAVKGQEFREPFHHPASVAPRGDLCRHLYVFLIEFALQASSDPTFCAALEGKGVATRFRKRHSAGMW
jgi:hypothetical protein